MQETEFKVNIPENPVAASPEEVDNLSREQLVELCKQLQATLANLSETVAFLSRKLFGRSREKLPIVGQMDLFGNIYGIDNGSESRQEGEQDQEPVKNLKVEPDNLFPPEQPEEKTRKPRSKRKDIFEGAETEEKLIPLPEDERVCEICGGKMTFVGKEKVRSEIVIEPIRVKVVNYFREVYACNNCKDEYGSFAYKKSELPVPLIDHSMASASAIGHIIFQKFINSMTFYRLEKELMNHGIPLSRETMSKWVIICALEYLKPIYETLFEEQKHRDILHGDETWCQVLKEPGKDPSSKSYIWLIVTGDDGMPPIITYHYSPTRAHTTAEELLGDYSGYFHTDKYDGYNCLEDHITRCLCWAHGRRKWYEAITSSIRDRDRSGLEISDLTPAEIGFLYCEKLFMIERKLKNLPPDERKARRLKDEKPILDSYWAWLDTLNPLKGSKLEKAVNYFKDAREGFENYLKDGRCSISNNLAENSARAYVVGRKNFLFHNSVNGAVASSIIYSIVLTAKQNNLDVRKYVETVLMKMPDYKNEPEGIQTLLPWSDEMQKECQRRGVK